MIRFRAADPSIFRSYAEKFPNAIQEDVGDYIFLEGEKNRPELKTYINRDLRPLVVGNSGNLFSVVGIETKSRCNVHCSFCPVNSKDDPRPDGELSLSLLRKIAMELQELQYQKTILLFGNNEPLLDRRLCDITSMFRSHCEHAYIKILTNGTLLNTKLALDLFDAGLSTLSINNYSKNGRLIKPVKELLENASQFLTRDVRIIMRNSDEVLTTRAGRASNKPKIPRALDQFCALPFVDINITYRGTVSMCCFDSRGETNFGDISNNTLKSIWSNASFGALRRSLADCDRSKNELCAACDFDGFRDPDQNFERPLARPVAVK